MTNAERRAALQARRAAALGLLLDDLLPLRGDERVVDVGAGTGAFAFAVAPRAASVVAVEIDPELAAHARAEAPANVDVVVRNGEELDLPDASFDVAGTLRTLHHTPSPERLIAELARVTKPGGTILVADQVAPDDPLGAFELNRFEVARDSSTTRLLSQDELRELFAVNGLGVLREHHVREPRDLDAYLDLAGCEGAARERARGLAPRGYEAAVSWFALAR